MNHLYGVTNHNPFFILNYLRKYKSELNDKCSKDFKVQILKLDSLPKKHANVILVPTISLFIKHKEFFNKNNVTAFVFDNPVACECLSCIELIDAKPKQAMYEYSFKKLEYDDVVSLVNATVLNISVTSKPIHVIATLLDDVKDSILSPLLNYFYSTKDLDTRLRLQKIIFSWMISDKDTDALKRKIVKITGKKSKSLDKLCEQLNTCIGVKTRKSISYLMDLESNKKELDYSKIEKKYGVASFDLKYLMTVVRKTD